MRSVTSRAFSLIELLVVIAIIALLIGILLPALAKARLSAQKLLGQANHRSVMQGVHLYSDQFDGHMPAGHDTARSVWTYTWPAMVRQAMGNDDKAMEVFLNPGVGGEFPVEWYKVIDESGRAACIEGNQTRWGYEAGEIMVKHSNGGSTRDLSRNGFLAFSMGWNECGTADVYAASPQNYSAFWMLGAGMHAPETEADGAQLSQTRVISEFGPKIFNVKSQADFIVVTDSFVNVNQDAWVSPLQKNGLQNMGGYFNGQGNASFLDGHVEALKVDEYNITEETLLKKDDPATRARIRRWNNDNMAHTGTWDNGGV